MSYFLICRSTFSLAFNSLFFLLYSFYFLYCILPFLFLYVFFSFTYLFEWNLLLFLKLLLLHNIKSDIFNSYEGIINFILILHCSESSELLENFKQHQGLFIYSFLIWACCTFVNFKYRLHYLRFLSSFQTTHNIECLKNPYCVWVWCI